jgi:hypothetical protein
MVSPFDRVACTPQAICRWPPSSEESRIGAGEAVENVVIGRRGKGDIVLDFNEAGTLLGVEIIGALVLAPTELLAEAERL